MKILLISANTLAAPYPVYPIGLDYVAGALDSGCVVEILDLNAKDREDALEVTLDRFRPDLIGLSLRNIDNTDIVDVQSYLDGYRNLVQQIRRRTPAPIVLGGSGFTIFPRRVLKTIGADYGVVGEGERLNRLVAALEKGDDPGEIEGVVTVRGPARQPRPWDQPLKRDFQPIRPHLDYYLRHGAMLNLQSKRGCPFRCIYCTYPHIEGRRMRLIPPAEVAATALALEDAGAKYLFMTDSAFNAHPTHSLSVAAAFREAGLKTPWGGFFAPTRPPQGYFSSLKAAGLTHVEFGTEALCDTVLASYGKPFVTAEVFRAHEAALEAGLHVAHYFLLGGPGETAETLAETLSNIDKLKKTVLFLFCGMRIYPHTALYERALAEGVISPTEDLLQPVFYQSPAISSEAILRTAREAARGRFNWVIGGGDAHTAALLERMYKRGFTGPLWEYLIRGGGAQ
ncbi:MAG: lipid biosynthesis B12-binding/radical SAM protein [Desulfosarcinaceae bacterium]|nr:lipid biosynthesis B12-binding/radical SAM protein [Desulfosarcinaceae bacterium]